jgi:hypothetical protein
VLLLVVATGGCESALSCPNALLSGVLVEQAGELVVQPESGGRLEHLQWPLGYAVRRDGNRLAIADPEGAIVARTDDIIRLGGGESVAGTWQVCGRLEAGPPAAD